MPLAVPGRCRQTINPAIWIVVRPGNGLDHRAWSRTAPAAGSAAGRAGDSGRRGRAPRNPPPSAPTRPSAGARPYPARPAGPARSAGLAPPAAASCRSRTASTGRRAQPARAPPAGPVRSDRTRRPRSGSRPHPVRSRHAADEIGQRPVRAVRLPLEHDPPGRIAAQRLDVAQPDPDPVADPRPCSARRSR